MVSVPDMNPYLSALFEAQYSVSIQESPVVMERSRKGGFVGIAPSVRRHGNHTNRAKGNADDD